MFPFCRLFAYLAGQPDPSQQPLHLPRIPRRLWQRMLPDPHHPPPRLPQRPRHQPIPLPIPRQLLLPERFVRRRLRPMPRTPVPETPIHKHRHPLPPPNKIRPHPKRPSRNRRSANLAHLSFLSLHVRRWNFWPTGATGVRCFPNAHLHVSSPPRDPRRPQQQHHRPLRILIPPRPYPRHHLTPLRLRENVSHTD